MTQQSPYEDIDPTETQEWLESIESVLRAEGPERLSPEWWRVPACDPAPRTRDYYAVEDEAGRRFWLYREGLYDRVEGDALPTWRLHGVFP